LTISDLKDRSRSRSKALGVKKPDRTGLSNTNDHVLYDNETTHLKCAKDALSARSVPKDIPKHGTNWGIEVSVHDPITGKLVYRPDGTVKKKKILMGNAQFRNGDPQPLYSPMDHPLIYKEKRDGHYFTKTRIHKCIRQVGTVQGFQVRTCGDRLLLLSNFIQ
jgi:hypothetical protein